MKVKAFDLRKNDYIKDKDANVISVRVNGGWTNILLTYHSTGYVGIIKVRNNREFEIDKHSRMIENLNTAVEKTIRNIVRIDYNARY